MLHVGQRKRNDVSIVIGKQINNLPELLKKALSEKKHWLAINTFAQDVIKSKEDYEKERADNDDRGIFL